MSIQSNYCLFQNSQSMYIEDKNLVFKTLNRACAEKNLFSTNENRVKLTKMTLLEK